MTIEPTTRPPSDEGWREEGEFLSAMAALEGDYDEFGDWPDSGPEGDWVVYNFNHPDCPRKRWKTELDAIRVARRLKRKRPYDSYHILKIMRTI
jgi:hypothetical protein